MEFTDFTELVRNEVEKRTGDGHSVRLVTINKNNGIVLNGITVLNPNCNISPTIYLNDFYDKYQDGTCTIGMITNNIMDIYDRNKLSESIDMDDFFNYEAIKHSIAYKLINTEKNRALLEDIPHVPFHDLSIVFECLVTQKNMVNASVLIRNAHMEYWNIGVEELHKTAAINTPFLRKCDIKNIEEMLACVTGMLDFGGFCSDFPMYVLSNKREIHGAACILYPNLLGDLSKASQSDLFIIPSSIHETLIMPDANPALAEPIKEMIREINKTLIEEEVLSDNLYIYERHTDELRML